ncbi:hypothetical protein SAMN04487786_1114 [Paenisporosarcina quisquiliarum]|nr:hypothetical protein SAMN04487786_1114 [Paenisporosarcina quisquiliarum]
MEMNEIIFVIGFVKKAEILGYRFEFEGRKMKIQMPLSEFGDSIVISEFHEFMTFVDNIIKSNTK